jgi:hypothetical protein
MRDACASLLLVAACGNAAVCIVDMCNMLVRGKPVRWMIKTSPVEDPAHCTMAGCEVSISPGGMCWKE